jgi:hypothetical protein
LSFATMTFPESRVRIVGADLAAPANYALRAGI